MAKLSNVTIAELQEALGDVSTGKAAKRLIIALAYKDGVAVEMLSERYGIPRSTIYSWLDRFEQMPIDKAIEDEDRPGRPPALTDSEREQLQSDLQESPQECGFPTDTWSIRNIQKYIEEKYGVEYSEGHIRRLLRVFDLESSYL